MAVARRMVSSISVVFFMLLLIVADSTFSSCYALTPRQTCNDLGDLACTDETCKKIYGDRLEYYCKPGVTPTVCCCMNVTASVPSGVKNQNGDTLLN
uniref:Uncharacterized protein n=1 Tax=Oryza sativa subsp. japonica TaxID=39947 RepID=Q2QZN7_ORYSJ|nr:hypothetical protein LOC_Os11g45360 [Oryza sativa Japonica Group]